MNRMMSESFWGQVNFSDSGWSMVDLLSAADTACCMAKDIGHVMGLKTIAEFVENDRVLAQLQALGIDHAQGFGIARPKSFDDLIAGLASADGVS